KVGSIETANIIWAAGIKASPLLETLQVEKDRMGRVYVNQDLSLPQYRDIFVLGDAAHCKDFEGNPFPALASVARQQGKFVGKMLKQDPEIESRPKFAYRDRGKMATIGRAQAVADINGWKFTGFFAWFLWSAIHIMLLVNFKNRLHVAIEWLWNYFTLKRGVQLITDRSGCIHCQTEPYPQHDLQKTV
ncbi:MAG TPA: NAD(P)/FAD-dependent oxidoreductase, partial [Salinimicrobium sp.]|nr:NAD(P)/FAD-dependent oxidoreductase [Salinimicrobium sp.]